MGAPSVLGRLWTRAAPHLVAAFVLYHLVGSTVDAIPNPSSGMDRRAWQEPRVQAEMQVWADRFAMPRAEFENRLFSLGTTYLGVRRTLMAPFEPYLKATGVRQYWSMFIAGSRYAERFEVRARRCPVEDASCDWETIFLQNTTEHRWRAETLENARVRSATFRWGWPHQKKQYARGCRSVARLAFADDPAWAAVQCAFQRGVSPSPRAPRPPPAKRDRELVVTRASLEEAP